MGAKVSQEVDAKLKIAFTEINNDVQGCIQRGFQDNKIRAICSNCKNISINVDGNTVENIASYNESCRGNISLTTENINKINSEFAQAAKAIAQQFQLSQADIREVVNLASTVATNVTNNNIQKCVQKVSQNAGLDVKCAGDPPPGPPSDFCQVNIRGNTFENRFDPYLDCFLQINSVTTVTSQIKAIIKQKGEAKVESIFGPIFGIILIILLIVGAGVVGGTKVLTDWKLWAVVIVLVILYLGVAFWLKWFPFNKDTS